MIDWTARAKAHFTQNRADSTDKTDRTPVSSVLSVGVGGSQPKVEGSFVGFVSTYPPLLAESDDYRLPPAIEARLLKLLSAGAIDERDAADIRGCYNANPADEWEQIFRWLED